jgi:hypothetical protein
LAQDVKILQHIKKAFPDSFSHIMSQEEVQAQAQRDIQAFALGMNRGHHWHSHLYHGICSGASSSFLQMLVVAAHLYAIGVAAPSVVSVARSSGLSPVMVQKQGVYCIHQCHQNTYKYGTISEC